LGLLPVIRNMAVAYKLIERFFNALERRGEGDP
jgi:hypothetical protein